MRLKTRLYLSASPFLWSGMRHPPATCSPAPFRVQGQESLAGGRGGRVAPHAGAGRAAPPGKLLPMKLGGPARGYGARSPARHTILSAGAGRAAPPGKRLPMKLGSPARGFGGHSPKVFSQYTHGILPVDLNQVKVCWSYAYRTFY